MNKLKCTIFRGGTSKVAIISKAEDSEYDVNYTFAQVSIDKAIVSYKGNCGNILSGVHGTSSELNLHLKILLEQ